MPTVAYVTDAGLGIVTNRLKGSGTEPNYIAVGTSATAAARTDTALGAEVESRVAGTSSQQTTTTTNDTYRVTGTVTATAARAIAEAALMDASTAGNMFVSSSFDVVNLDTGDSLTLTFNNVFDN